MTTTLQPTAEQDLDFVIAAEADTDVRPWILPWSRERHREALAAPDLAHLLAVDERSARALGFVILAGLEDRENRCIEFRRLVIAERGRGLGRAVIGSVCELVYNGWGAHRLWLDVKQKNARARHLYRSAGFVEEGVLRECLAADGGWESLVLMSMLAHERLAHD